MPLAVDDLAWIRSFIGDDTPPTDLDLDAIYDRVETVAGTAAEIVRKRIAVLLSAPASFAVDGYSQNAAANISAYQKLLAYLEELATTGSTSLGTRIVQLVRDRPGR
jgi:hypothetical protein